MADINELRSLPRIFIKSNFKLTISGTDYTFLNQPLSLFGISGLRWRYFDPSEKVGEKIHATVDVLAKNRFRIETDGIIIFEQTADAHYLGVRFLLSTQDKAKLSQAIEQEGFHPTAYIRKYPRIPAYGKLPDMPMRAIIKDQNNELIAFDIANMSPNGILLYTENPNAIFFKPSSRIQVQVEPRGMIFEPFHFEGIICRLMQDKNLESNNWSRYLGIRFTHINEANKQTFLEMLKAVIKNLHRAGMIQK